MIYIVMKMNPDSLSRDMWAFRDLHSAWVFCDSRFGVDFAGWNYHDAHGIMWIAKDDSSLTIDELRIEG